MEYRVLPNGARIPVLTPMTEKLEAPKEHPQIYLGNKRAGSKHKLRKPTDIMVAIDRPSGSIFGNRAGGNQPDRVSSINTFEQWFNKQLTNPRSEISREISKIMELISQGKTVCLMCWCYPKPCHGRVILNHIIGLLEQK